MELVNFPLPVPSLVQLSPVSGLAAVLQHTPREVTVSLPSEVTLPPPEAVAEVMAETGEVVTVGTTPVAALPVRTQRQFREDDLAPALVPPLPKLTTHAALGVVA